MLDSNVSNTFNSTDGSTTLPPSGIEFTVTVVLIPILVIDVFLICALVKSGPLPVVIRITLINILLACIVLALGQLEGIVSQYIFDENLYQYRVFFLLVGFGAVARVLFTGYYAILVFIYIRFVFCRIKLWAVILGCIVIWIIAFSVNVPYLFRESFPVYIKAEDNKIGLTPSVGLLLTIFAPIVLATIFSFSMSIILPIVALRYIKKAAEALKVAQDAHISNRTNASNSRAIIRLSLFLTVGTTFSFLGHVIPATLLVVFQNGSGAAILVGLAIHHFSLIPTPIHFIVFMKHIRENIKKFCYTLCCKQVD